MSALEDSAKRNEEIKTMCIDWYRKTLNKRRCSAKITDVKIIKPSASCKVIRLKIIRDDASLSMDRLDSLVRFGVSEWVEIGICLLKSQSSAKAEVDKYIADLQTKFRTYRKRYNIVHTPAEEEIINNLMSGRPPPKSKPKSKKEDVFSQMAREGKVPDTSNLDLSLPILVPHPSTTVISEPTHGIFFNNALGQISFFRSSQIPVADTTFLHGIIQIIPMSAKDFYVATTDELKKRDAEPHLSFE
ncbi:hypothetical protein L6452_22518 [Arctium lappa]|uniref:Uncharacterized protein n=1 Tax=Arctium lappa TaxID=4217 RepID=A0ACB9AZE5_ARCLA|nr:hypothetical protein L6452_22518 [Arctium lappa]